MATGHVERLKSGRYRAVVYAGRDPITGRTQYLKESHADEFEAEKAKARLVAQVEAENHPDLVATVDTLIDAWLEVADHGINTQATTEVYLRRVIRPKLGEMRLRKLQHRVDILDRMYKHLQRCSSLCDGKPFVEHKRTAAHRCEVVKCRPHVC
jgi:integrase